MRIFPVCSQGVATGWTGVDMSTPLLPEVVPEIDANPVGFYSGVGVGGITITWGLGNLQNTENAANLLLPLGTKS